MSTLDVRARCGFLLCSLFLMTCGSKGTPSNPINTQHQTPNNTLKLVVLIVIDQLPSWSFGDDLPELSGGLAKLANEGLYFPTAEIPYASTNTAPGHALIGTGATPSVSGVLANEWFDPKTRKEYFVAQDPNTKIFALNTGALIGVGASSIDLKVEGIAESMRSVPQRGTSVSLGLKDRAAVHMAGQKPDVVLWYDDDQTAFTTSTFYTESLPAWVVEHSKNHPIASRLNYVWHPTLPESSRYPRDDNDGEGGSYGLGMTFPHDIQETNAPSKAMKSTPLGVDVTWELASSAIDGESLGQDNITDLLAITLSTHDYAGHGWGQESWERREILHHIDKTLTGFIALLDQKVGKDQYGILLTSDHGATPLVEQSKLKGLDAHRVPLVDIVAAAQNSVTSVLGKGKWVEGIWANAIYFTEAFYETPKDKQQQAMQKIVVDAKTIPGAGFAGLSHELVKSCATSRGAESIACHSIRLGESGDVYVSTAPYSLPKGNYPKGTGHGGPADHDRLVPLIVWAPGVAASVNTSQISMECVAPTLTDLLDVPAPPHAKGKSVLP